MAVPVGPVLEWQSSPVLVVMEIGFVLASWIFWWAINPCGDEDMSCRWAVGFVVSHQIEWHIWKMVPVSYKIATHRQCRIPTEIMW